MNTNYKRNKNTVLHRESRWYFMSCVLLTRSTANEWKRLWQGKKASFENTWNTWRRLASWQRRKLSRFGKVKEWWNLRAMWSRSRSGTGGTTEECLGFFSQSVIYRFRLLECSDLWIWTNDWDLKSETRWRYFWNLLESFLAFDSSTWRPLSPKLPIELDMNQEESTPPEWLDCTNRRT